MEIEWIAWNLWKFELLSRIFQEIPICYLVSDDAGEIKPISGKRKIYI